MTMMSIQMMKKQIGSTISSLLLLLTLFSSESTCIVNAFTMQPFVPTTNANLLLTATKPASSSLLSTSTSTSRMNFFHKRRQTKASSLLLSMTSGEITEEGEDIQVAGVEDKNGQPFRVGGVVRVCVENRKAYQVPAKSYGTFNIETKQFVPADEADLGNPKKRNLLLPVGMRGVVIKVYDNAKISANFPIQVKFVPGENTEEGFDSPCQFIMHFETDEVECVV